MLTEAQETAYIHGLLPRLLDPDNSILLVEDLVKAGYSNKESSAVIERLETEGLVKRGYSTTVLLTTLGRRVARSPRGYTAHLRWQRWQSIAKEFRDGLGAYGSLIGGLTGVVGAVVAIISLRDSGKTTSEMDGIRTQLRALTQAQAITNTRLALLEQQRVASTNKPTISPKRAAPSNSGPTTKPAPSPASAPVE